MSFTADQLADAILLADAFDTARHCGWNSSQRLARCTGSPVFSADEVPPFDSLGDQCHGTLLELALLHTLRPCKKCGGDVLYKHGYGIGCCSCLGDHDDCEDCQDGGCRCYAENANLPDAITRWNLEYGNDGPRGKVTVLG